MSEVPRIMSEHGYSHALSPFILEYLSHLLENRTTLSVSYSVILIVNPLLMENNFQLCILKMFLAK